MRFLSFKRSRQTVFILAAAGAACVVGGAYAWPDLPKIVHGTAADVVAWKAPTSPVADPPIGAILPYYGDPRELEGTGWVPCDGSACPEWADARLAAFLRDHAAEKIGCIPNLNDGRFLRGAVSLDEIGRSGGTEEIAVDGEHSHESGGRKLKRGGDDSTPENHSYAAGAHDHGGENRPPFVNVCYIMRVK